MPSKNLVRRAARGGKEERGTGVKRPAVTAHVPPKAAGKDKSCGGNLLVNGEEVGLRGSMEDSRKTKTSSGDLKLKGGESRNGERTERPKGKGVKEAKRGADNTLSDSKKTPQKLSSSRSKKRKDPEKASCVSTPEKRNSLKKRKVDVTPSPTSTVDSKLTPTITNSSRFSQEVYDYLYKWASRNPTIPIPNDQERAKLLADTGLEKRQLSDCLYKMRKKYRKMSKAAGVYCDVPAETSAARAPPSRDEPAVASVVKAPSSPPHSPPALPAAMPPVQASPPPPSKKVSTDKELFLMTQQILGRHQPENAALDVVPSVIFPSALKKSKGLSDAAKEYLENWISLPENAENPYPSRELKDYIMARFQIDDKSKLNAWLSNARRVMKRRSTRVSNMSMWTDEEGTDVPGPNETFSQHISEHEPPQATDETMINSIGHEVWTQGENFKEEHDTDDPNAQLALQDPHQVAIGDYLPSVSRPTEPIKGLSEHVKAYLEKWISVPENKANPYPSREWKDNVISQFAIDDPSKLEGWFSNKRRTARKRMKVIRPLQSDKAKASSDPESSSESSPTVISDGTTTTGSVADASVNSSEDEAKVDGNGAPSDASSSNNLSCSLPTVEGTSAPDGKQQNKKSQHRIPKETVEYIENWMLNRKDPTDMPTYEQRDRLIAATGLDKRRFENLFYRLRKKIERRLLAEQSAFSGTEASMPQNVPVGNLSQPWAASVRETRSPAVLSTTSLPQQNAKEAPYEFLERWINRREDPLAQVTNFEIAMLVQATGLNKPAISSWITHTQVKMMRSCAQVNNNLAENHPHATSPSSTTTSEQPVRSPTSNIDVLLDAARLQSAGGHHHNVSSHPGHHSSFNHAAHKVHGERSNLPGPSMSAGSIPSGSHQHHQHGVTDYIYAE